MSDDGFVSQADGMLCLADAPACHAEGILVRMNAFDPNRHSAEAHRPKQALSLHPRSGSGILEKICICN